MDDLERETFDRRLVLAGFTSVALLIAALFSMLGSNHLLSLFKQSEDHLLQKLNQRASEIEMLLSLSTQLTVCNSKAEAFQVIQLIASLLLPEVQGALALLRSSKDQLEVVTSWNGEWVGTLSYAPPQCWGLRTGKTHLGDPGSGHIACDHFQGKGQQILCIPLIAQGETHGVLHLASHAKKAWSQEEKQLATALGEQTSLTLANLRLRESLKQQAIRDSLTGLYNRRFLLERFDHELSRSLRRTLPLGVLMIDLDYFKRFNDEHGHDVGDYILSEFGRLLRTILRDEDVACRYGGEEFTVLLPDTDIDDTLAVAEKIGSKVREYSFVRGDRAVGPITISIGAATCPEHGRNVEQLLKQADDALYEAKRQGRNRVVVATPAGNEAADLS